MKPLAANVCLHSPTLLNQLHVDLLLDQSKLLSPFRMLQKYQNWILPSVSNLLVFCGTTFTQKCIFSTKYLSNKPILFDSHSPLQSTVLPRLVSMRTIKLMSFLIKKKTINFEQFLEIFGIFSRETLIWSSYDTDKLYLPTQKHSKS